MKKVIFVCLLSLSVCLSAPNQTQEAAPAPASASPSAAPVVTGTDANAAPKPEHPVAKANETAPKPPATVPAQNTPATNSTQPAPTSNETSSKTNETKPSEKPNTTDPKTNTDATVKPTEKVPEPAKDKTENKTVVPVAPTNNNGTNADSKDGKKNETTTTPKADNVSPTVAPVQTKTRAFDGPSFIGGIILTLGLLAIGFMGFKYYKNQTERNYHTL